ncbi:hypothetical protein ATCC90586_011895 [Pythium insidiosum]|nr:hypothetical protein ATCC90586_011895 [Pythium insidiosum]
MRRQLIARELQLLAGVDADAVAPVLLLPIDLLHTAPSAPDEALMAAEHGMEAPNAPAFTDPHDDATAPSHDDDLPSTRSKWFSSPSATPSAPELPEEEASQALLHGIERHHDTGNIHNSAASHADAA